MALTSNVVINLASGTAILTCTTGGGPVETLTYSRSTNTIEFYKRDPIVITGNEFIAFSNQINIFQTAIISNFAPLQASTIPFEQMIVNEFHDTGSATWSLLITPLTGSDVCDYTATLSSLDVALADRNPTKTIEFPEWVVFLAALSHYRLSIRNFLGL